MKTGLDFASHLVKKTTISFFSTILNYEISRDPCLPSRYWVCMLNARVPSFEDPQKTAPQMLRLSRIFFAFPEFFSSIFRQTFTMTRVKKQIWVVFETSVWQTQWLQQHVLTVKLKPNQRSTNVFWLWRNYPESPLKNYQNLNFLSSWKYTWPTKWPFKDGRVYFFKCTTELGPKLPFDG